MATAPLLIEAATRNQVLLERLKSGEVEKVAELIREIDRAVRLELSRSNLTDYRRDQLERMLSGLSGVLLAMWTRFSGQLLLDLVDVAEYQASFEARSLEQVMVSMGASTPAVAVLRASVLSQPLQVSGPDGGRLLEPFIQGLSAVEAERITGAIRRGFVQGKTSQQVIQEIRGTRARQYADGLLSITSRNAEAVVRTGIQHAAMVARMETLQANTDIVTGYEWVSTLDSRTTAQCRSLDGRVFEFGKGPVPPIHIRCRSSITPVLDGRYAFLREGATRASRTGQVDATLTYYEWLKRQSPAFQDEALGKARAELFRGGGLTAERFAELQLDRNFKPLSLDEMRRLEPLAFERAGI